MSSFERCHQIIIAVIRCDLRCLCIRLVVAVRPVVWHSPIIYTLYVLPINKLSIVHVFIKCVTDRVWLRLSELIIISRLDKDCSVCLGCFLNAEEVVISVRGVVFFLGCVFLYVCLVEPD